jgi:hypothetical protein
MDLLGIENVRQAFVVFIELVASDCDCKIPLSVSPGVFVSPDTEARRPNMPITFV